jgi:hypothetical protein
MKKIFSIIFLYTFLSSCTPDNPTTPPSGAVTVKYEIILSSPLFQLAPNVPTPSISYTNATAQGEIANNFNYGSTSWTKTVNITATRPVAIGLACFSPLYLNTAGTMTANIYVNGVVKATQTNPTQNNSGLYSGGAVYLNYFLQ